MTAITQYVPKTSLHVIPSCLKKVDQVLVSAIGSSGTYDDKSKRRRMHNQVPTVNPIVNPTKFLRNTHR